MSTRIASTKNTTRPPVINGLLQARGRSSGRRRARPGSAGPPMIARWAGIPRRPDRAAKLGASDGAGHDVVERHRNLADQRIDVRAGLSRFSHFISRLRNSASEATDRTENSRNWNQTGPARSNSAARQWPARRCRRRSRRSRRRPPSPARRGQPTATDRALVDALVAVRRRHPRWGAEVLAMARRRIRWRPGRVARPCAICCAARGLIVPRPRRPRVPHGGHALSPITGPNDTWTTDFKGEFRTGDRRYCYPLTLRDGFSRYVLRCDALLSRSYALDARAVSNRLPTTACRCAFAVITGARLPARAGSALAAQRLVDAPGDCARTDRPGRPEQNGSHEQFHRVLKAETTRPPGDGSRAATPLPRVLSEVQRGAAPREPRGSAARDASIRLAPSVAARLPPLEYPGPHGGPPRVERRLHLVARQPDLLTEVLEGEDVGFEEVADGSGPCPSPRSAWVGSMNGPDG